MSPVFHGSASTATATTTSTVHRSQCRFGENGSHADGDGDDDMVGRSEVPLFAELEEKGRVCVVCECV